MEAKAEKSTKKKIRFSASSSGDLEEEQKSPKRFNKNMRSLQPLPPISPIRPSTTGAVGSAESHGQHSSSSASGSSHASSDRMPDEKPRTGGGVSSQRTVIIIAAFLVVGFIFVTAGILVLWREHHYAFKIAGGSFLAIGLLSFVWCIFLQQKNFKNLVHELEKDIYFGHIVENHVIRRLLSYDS